MSDSLDAILRGSGGEVRDMSRDTSFQKARKALLALVLAALPLAAQTGLGVVRGTVLDASKGVIPNAKVTLTNTATGVAKESQTNAAGIYYFGAVPIGPYTVGVEAQGFKPLNFSFGKRRSNSAFFVKGSYLQIHLPSFFRFSQPAGHPVGYSLVSLNAWGRSINCL